MGEPESDEDGGFDGSLAEFEPSHLWRRFEEKSGIDQDGMDKYNGHEFITIESGLSFLGSGPLDAYASDKEKPLREVLVSDFRISKYPTTKLQLAVFLQEVQAHLVPSETKIERQALEEKLGAEAMFPATGISVEIAELYCLWLSDRSDETVVLPTEAEWEKAARGGETRIWPWGNTFSVELCNCGEVPDPGFCSVLDLAKGASPYGCCHMAGGVWEWCEDFYHSYNHPAASFKDPINLFPAGRRVVKGGSAFCTKEIVRPACRDWTNSINQGGGDDGFRVAIRTWRKPFRAVHDLSGAARHLRIGV